MNIVIRVGLIQASLGDNAPTELGPETYGRLVLSLDGTAAGIFELND